MQPIYTKLKVHNEVEICELTNLECKALIEQELLKNRVSYFVKWPTHFKFGKKKNLCGICVNEADAERAREIIEDIAHQQNVKVRYLMKKIDNEFL